MTVETSPLISRRRRTVLLGSIAEDVADDVVQDMASQVRAELKVCRSTSELSKLVESERDTLCVVILGQGFPDLLSSARLVAQKAPLCELVLLAADDEEEASYRRHFGLSPRLGNHWQFASPSYPGLGKLLRAVFQRADQRKATRTTLDRFNARLSVPAETVDTRELRQLVISDRFLSSILESAFDAVILVDRAGAISSFNPSAERLFGRVQNQVLSHPVDSLSGGSWARDLQAAFTAQQKGQLFHSSVEMENGSKSVEIALTPVYDRSQNLLATSLIVRDVTARLQSEQALRTNEKLAAVGKLASTIAHEINNPLEAVTNLIYLARLSSGEAEVRDYLDQADHELQRMAAITSQTLHFHKQASSPKLISCEELFSSVLGVYRGRLSAGHIDVQTRWRARRPVSCLEGEIRQVLNNLVGNAIDSMPSGGELRIRSREGTNWKTGAKGVVLTVADTGTGMDPKTLQKIFDAFFTTKGSAGTGLGLWVSHEIVQRHHGTAHVRSRQWERKSGTVFTIFLPFQAAVP